MAYGSDVETASIWPMVIFILSTWWIHIQFTDKSPLNIPWPVLRNKWKAKVVQLAKEKGIYFKETPVSRKPGFPGGGSK